jgi:cyclopropane fatty-acyl-phospholipid synthase-like methyltransferase
VAALAASLPPGAAVLDVGCGNGEPLTRVLLEHGCEVLGVDSSANMLARFRESFPHVPVVHSQIQTCDFGGRMFDAAIAWGVIFHLPHEEQSQAFAAISRALQPGAPFLFTAGDKDGWIDGAPMNGVPFRYYSFTVDGYRDLLRSHRLVLENTHADRGENIYYLARKID